LVIFEYLARSFDEWTKTRKTPDDLTDTDFVLSKPEPGERVALWRLEGQIEKTLPEIFNPEYQRFLAEEKQRLVQEMYGSYTQES
jgi:hypothetical protein